MADVSVNVGHPKAVFVKITTEPTDQEINGNYSVVCTRGFSAGSKSGSYDGFTTFIKKLTLTPNPDSCTVAALGSFVDGGGHIVVELWAST